MRTVFTAATPAIQKEAIMIKIWLALCFAVPLFSAAVLMGQQTQPPSSAAADEKTVISNEEIDLLRRDIRSQRKQIIAQNLNLTDAEAQRFWPVYDRYTADLIKINDLKYKLIQDYLQSTNQMTDAQVNTWIEQWLRADEDTVSLRKKYLPEFQNVLPAKKVGLYQQLDRRTQLMIDLQLASQIPLIEPGH